MYRGDEIMRKRKLVGLLICTFILSIAIKVCGQEVNMKNTEYIEQIYRIGFSKYLLEKLDLQTYDDELKENEMNFIPCDEEHKTDAQKKDELKLNYIFVRNDVHVERLSDEQQAVLRRQDLGGVYSNEAMDIIEETYVDVMGYKKIESEEDKTAKTFYDEQFEPVFVTFDTIVIKIATMHEYDKNGNYVNKEHEYEKEEALEKYAANMEKKLQGKLGNIPISVQIEI